MTDTPGGNQISIRSFLDPVSKDNAEEVIIDLQGRCFHEQVVIDRPHVTLCNGTIVCDLGAYELLEDGFKRGTFRTASLFVDADHVTLKNMRIINENGYQCGQAIALMIDGGDFRAIDCQISSYQDTLFLAPLPEREYEERGFIGPLRSRERIHREALFDHCLIEGSVDFIFGGGMGYFSRCEIRSRNIGKEINGYVCAPNTPADQEYGFVFDRCDFTSEIAMEDSVYLARPWRDYGKCLIAYSKIGKHIRKEGYDDWNKPWARKTCCFKEYDCMNENPAKRVDWMKQVLDTDLEYIKSLRRRNDERDLQEDP